VFQGTPTPDIPSVSERGPTKLQVRGEHIMGWHRDVLCQMSDWKLGEFRGRRFVWETAHQAFTLLKSRNNHFPAFFRSRPCAAVYNHQHLCVARFLAPDRWEMDLDGAIEYAHGFLRTESGDDYWITVGRGKEYVVVRDSGLAQVLAVRGAAYCREIEVNQDDKQLPMLAPLGVEFLNCQDTLWEFACRNAESLADSPRRLAIPPVC